MHLDLLVVDEWKSQRREFISVNAAATDTCVEWLGLHRFKAVLRLAKLFKFGKINLHLFERLSELLLRLWRL